MARDNRSAQILDTLAYSKKLIAAGFSQKQAEVQASALFSLLRHQLFTKKDLSQVKKDLNGVKQDLNGVKQDLNGVKQDLNGVKKDLDGVKYDLTGVKHDLTGVKQELKEIKENYASKRDLHEMQHKLETKFSHDIQILSRDMKIWFGTMLVVLVTVMPAISTFLHYIWH